MSDSTRNPNTSFDAASGNRSKADALHSLQYLIFDDEQPDDWVQDVWGMSSMLGDTASKLLEAFEAVVESCPDDAFDQLVRRFEQAVAEQNRE